MDSRRSPAPPASPAEPAEAAGDASTFLNRELGQLEFLRRVLTMARDPETPLLERVRFLTISSLVLDEFFEIRVGGLCEQLALNFPVAGPDGLQPQEVMARIRAEALDLVSDQYRTLNEELIPALAEQGIVVYRRGEWPEAIDRFVAEYFEREVLPVLSPVGLDPAHPFPRILNKSLNFVVSLNGTDAFGRRSRAAIVQAPRILPRLLEVPDEISEVPHGFVLLSSIIHAHVERLFPGMEVTGCHQFRVTRDSDLWIDEEEVEDFLQALKGELPGRQYGQCVRLEVSDTCTDEMARFLLERFSLGEDALYRVDGPVNLHRLSALCDKVNRSDLVYPPFVPGLPRRLKKSGGLFSVIRDGDLLLHHPYESFGPVVELVQAAAADPSVLAIKATLYRTEEGSKLARALLDAARAGKEVTCVVELRARFDEAANIELASRLQEAGAKVVYGVVGFKAHAKMLLIVRREGTKLRRYVHLGTGNYNARTARLYTDFSLLTCRAEVGADVHDVFLQLTGLGKVGGLRQLLQTPFALHDRILEHIDFEIAEARAGRPARIAAKMNSLIEQKVISALYRASQAGVKVDLIVRGICCLRPGVPGLSENIRVRSIIGRFLEHHRVYHFHAAGRLTTYCASADWMPRNFFRRVEVAFPIIEPADRDRVLEEGLELYLRDDTLAWDMGPDGRWVRVPNPQDGQHASQRMLLARHARRS